MTSRPGATGGESNEPEKDSDAVRAGTTDTATDEGADALVEETTAEIESRTAASEPDEEARDSEADTQSEDDGDGDESEPKKPRFTISLPRLVAFAMLPLVVMLLAVAGGYLKWQSSSIRASQVSDVESVGVAKDATVAMLSYQPDTVDKDLGAARDRLTGTFKDSYTQLTHDVVIPGAKQRHISAVATVPAAAAVSATANHAVVLVFVNQTVAVGNDAPTATASSVRVTLDKVGGRWLVSGFDPV
jgi:Mce-associated membrane protein